MAKKKNVSSNKAVFDEINEVVKETSMNFLVDVILRMFKHSKLKGFDLVTVLVTLLTEVIYSTCDDDKRNKVQWEKVSKLISKKLLEGLMFYDKAEKEEEK